MNTVYKVYNDGSNYVGTKYFLKSKDMPRDNISSYSTEFRAVSKTSKKDSVITILDKYFDAGFYDSFAYTNFLKRCDYIIDYIKLCYKNECGFDFPETSDSFINDFVKNKLNRKINNLQSRIRRFKRKAYLNDFNYFTTFTYSDTLHTEDTFTTKLKKCLSNLAYMRGWRYMCVFERSKTGRLHVHALLYVPEGQMIGTLIERNDFNFENERKVKTNENTHFLKKFGRNDFKEICTEQLKIDNILDYIIKYLWKSTETIFYSRHLKTEIFVACDDNDGHVIICSFVNFHQKYVFFPDILNNGTHINMRRRN